MFRSTIRGNPPLLSCAVLALALLLVAAGPAAGAASGCPPPAEAPPAQEAAAGPRPAGPDRAGALRTELWRTLALANRCRDSGSARAEAFYRRAVELAPDDPWALESAARYFRVYRGPRGLFAESEAYYLRAEEAVNRALARARASPVLDRAATSGLLDLREQILRGRIELNKGEGLGLVLPAHPGQRLGLYLAGEFDYGRIPFAHDALATDALRLDQPPASMLRKSPRLRLSERLRLRYGTLPYLDFSWRGARQDDALADANTWMPLHFENWVSHELELAVEDRVAVQPLADLQWRLAWRRGEIRPDDPKRERFDGVTGSATLTRGFGSLKIDLDLLGSYSAFDPNQSSHDWDRSLGATLRVLHFGSPDYTSERPIDPRAQEYRFGMLRSATHYKGGGGVKVVDETYFAGVKLSEWIPRTDLELLPNLFRKVHEGVSGLDSAVLEINAILTRRILDRVNDVKRRQADALIGLAQWAVSVRGFGEISLRSPDDFESRGVVFSSFVEVFSGVAHRSTLIVEGNYELRSYPHLGRLEHFFRFGLRIGV